MSALFLLFAAFAQPLPAEGAPHAETHAEEAPHAEPHAEEAPHEVPTEVAAEEPPPEVAAEEPPPHPVEAPDPPQADAVGEPGRGEGSHAEHPPVAPLELAPEPVEAHAEPVEAATEPTAEASKPRVSTDGDLLPFPFDFGWAAPTASSPAPVTGPVPVPVQIQQVEGPWASYQIPLPERGLRAALRLLFWLLAAVLASRQLGRIREGLLPSGLLPSAAALGEQILRLAAILTGVLLLAAILPEALLPILPLAALGGALALGVSVWTVLPDLWAGVLLSVEQRVRAGQWIRAGDLAGEVVFVGLRSTQILERSGGLVLVPNRMLIEQAVASDAVNWPPVDIAVPVPESLSTEQVRELLQEAVLLSPFLAPDEEPALIQEQFHPPIWRVRARIVEAHWADEFEGALRERVRELLESS